MLSVLLVIRVLKAQRVLRAFKVQLELRVIPVILALKVLRVHKASKVLPEPRAIQALKAQLVRLVILVHKDLRVLKVAKAFCAVAVPVSERMKPRSVGLGKSMASPSAKLSLTEACHKVAPSLGLSPGLPPLSPSPPENSKVRLVRLPQAS